MKNRLIEDIEQVIKPPYEDFVVGLTSDNKKYGGDRQGGLVIFDYRDDAIALDAYNYFVSNGMVGKPPIGRRSKYLYLYRVDGAEILGFF